LLDFSGNQIGTTAQPAYLRVALCGFGQTIPTVPGTGEIAKIASWPADLPYIGAQLTVKLWGNDVINPTGTYYSIAVLDTNKNVIQSGAFQFVGTQSVDLSSVPQLLLSSAPAFSGFGLTIVNYSPVLNLPVVSTPIVTYNVLLTGGVTTVNFSGLAPGQIVFFEITQDGAGSHPWAWPATVKGGGAINPAANSVSSQGFIFDGTYLRTIGPISWT
jgi:hypothetical protein